MNADLELSLANNAKAWQALSHSISQAEDVQFDNTHDRLFATYGPNLMAHVYRTAIKKVLQNLPDAERSKLLTAFQQAFDGAIKTHSYTQPTSADCSACHSRQPTALHALSAALEAQKWDAGAKSPLSRQW